MTSNLTAFQFHNFSTSAPSKLFEWKPGTRHTPTDLAWPPTGVHLQLEFVRPAGAPAALSQVRVVVHYELYDGLPTFRKWVSVHNGAGYARDIHVAPGAVTVDSLVMEILRAPNFAPERMSVITQQANIAVDETVILPTLSLHPPVDTPTKGRGGCSRMTVLANG